jgi:cytochrome c oxidase assembly factor CtaG
MQHWRLTALVAFAMSVGHAQAHAVGPPVPLWQHWNADPLVSVPMLVTTVLYGLGFAKLRRRLGRMPAALGPTAPILFMLGLMVTATALLSFLDALSAVSLSVHMVQHVLLIAVAPPLLLAGRPEFVCAHGLPRRWRSVLARNRIARRILVALGWATNPMIAAILHGAAVWLWHLPSLFEAARGSPSLHALEHACFFGSALFFWRGIFASFRDAGTALAGAAASLLTLIQGGFLGALIGLSPVLLYPTSTQGAGVLGLTPLEDQHLAGAIMWVPLGILYLIVGLALVARAIRPGERWNGAAVASVTEAKPVSAASHP